MRKSGEKEKMGFLQGYTGLGLQQGVGIVSVLAVVTTTVGRVLAASLLGSIEVNSPSWQVLEGTSREDAPFCLPPATSSSVPPFFNSQALKPIRSPSGSHWGSWAWVRGREGRLNATCTGLTCFPRLSPHPLPTWAPPW